MKKYLSKILPILIIIGISVYIPVIPSTAEDADQGKPTNKKNEAAAPKISYLENILFTKLPGKERISLVVSHQPVIKVEGQINGSLLVKLENTSAPENLQRQLGEGELNNILRVTPSQQLAEGKQWIYLTIDIKEIVPYAIKQDGQNVFIDFNVSSLVEKKAPMPPLVNGKTPETTKKKGLAKVTAETAKSSDDDVEDETIKVKPVKKEAVKRYVDRTISLDFQDADIKSVLRLMAEYGNISIVSGDDVKGNVTLSMKNVPWEQALDSILDIHGLTKKQMGDVISVMTLERKKKDEGDKVKAEEDQRKAEDQRKERETKILAEKGKLRQILIEAKIIEATEKFVRNLGIQWGFSGAQSIGSYGSRIAGGTNTLSQTNSLRSPYPSEITATDTSGNPLYMAAVNMPALAAATISPTLGVVFGAGTAFLEAQIAALETTTSGKIISTPKVVTMDNVKATIKQGEEVPYVTPGAIGATATVTFKDALLKLEVKPKITDEGRISMEIKCSNDRAVWTEQVLGNPPIAKNEVESTVVIQDGDTVVIGGISVDNDEKIISGVPWFYKIPVLGWLFKSEQTTKDKKQLIVFITPRILKGDRFVESSEKVIN